jgi:hypothetical protein
MTSPPTNPGFCMLEIRRFLFGWVLLSSIGAGFSNPCQAEALTGSKASDVRAIALAHGVDAWAEKRRASRHDRMQRIQSRTWQHLQEAWSPMPEPVRLELQAVLQRFVDAASRQDDAEVILATWERELSDQLSEQEARTLRAFCESDVGRKMIAATAAGNQAVTRMLNERADDHINEAYQKLLQEAEAVQQKHMGAERTPGR